MEQQSPKRERVLSVEGSQDLFEMLGKIYPHILREVGALSSNSPDLFKAITGIVVEEISYTPYIFLSRDRIRKIVEAPPDELQLEQWQTQFLDQHNNVIA